MENNIEDFYAKLGREVYCDLEAFDKWYIDNITSANDDLKFNIKAIVTFDKIANKFRELKEEENV